jgi:PTH1 family peptidyl-tRNA hydrolase
MRRAASADGTIVRLVAGLGNPGSRFVGTRHNIGYRVVDELASRRAARLDREECKALVGTTGDLLLAKPLTYMNRSGYALRCLVDRYAIEPAEVLVIYDEVHLPLGRLRLRRNGEPAGHRGMESIVQNLRTTEIPRLRLGVGPQDRDLPGEQLVDYVLGAFAADESVDADAMVGRAADAAEAWLDKGVDEAMNLFNRPAAAS